MLTYLHLSLAPYQAAEPITLLTRYINKHLQFICQLPLCFVDLEKAFDRAVREGTLALSKRAHLENVDFPPVVVRGILRMNENNWRVLAKATRLIAALHSGSWFRYGGCPSVAETRQCGRQGGKLGSTIFIILYAEALVRLQSRLFDEGFVAKVGSPSQPSTPETVTLVLLGQ